MRDLRTITYKLTDLGKAVIHLGKANENEATRVQIDAGVLFAEYPTAVPTLKVINPAGTVYSAEVTRDGDYVLWDIKDSDLTENGSGEFQLTFTENGVVVKSAISRTQICPSITGGGTAPDPVQDWLDHAEEVLEEVEDAFPEGGTTGQVLAKKSDADFDTEWVDQGAGGVSDYDDLENRPQIGGVTLTGNVSLHDIGAAAEADIPDPTSIIDDTAGDGDTNKVWSADKTDSELADVKSAIQQKYEKPQNGIPASDLASGVIPDVSGFYTKPQTGIPASDLADDVIPDVSGKQDAPTSGAVAGKVLGLDNNLDPIWTDQPSVDPEDIADAVSDWLDDHPEATTTVEDGAISYAKLNSTLKSDVIADSASGMICKFFDGADGIPVDKCKIVFNPTQSGEGEPSSQNIRPFIGFTGSKITHIGKNLLDISQYDKSQTYNEIIVDKEHDQLINRKVYADSASRIVFTQQFPAGTYTFYGKIKGSGSDALRFISTAEFANSRWNNSYQGYWVNVENNKLTFTVSTSTQLKLAFKTRSGHANEEATAYNIMFASGTGNEYSMSWSTQAGSLYGFIADYIAGKVIKTHERIASYNGEELPGVWYSDRDVYEEGTTPTTGAEVVYELSEPVEYVLTGTSINSFLKENNMWSDVEGSIECDYRCNTAEYMKKYVEQEISPVRDRIIPVNPKMFGAVGDGTTDDSEAMQAAFDYASTNNVPIDVSNGVYLIGNIVLYNNRKYEIYGHCALETGIEYYHKPFPSIIVKQNTVGFIGNRTSEDNVLSSIPNVFMNIHDIILKGENGTTLPICFKDIKFKCSMFTNVVANWFSCFIEGTIGGNSIISGCKIRNISECVFRSWVDKYNLNSDPAFTDCNINHNEFMGLTKHNNTLYTPTLFEANRFYLNEFSHNFVAVMFGVIGTYSNFVSMWRSTNNIYSYCLYLAIYKGSGSTPSNYRLYSSRLENDYIWYQSAYIIHNRDEAKTYFDDYNGDSRIVANSIPFFSFDSIEYSALKGLIFRGCETKMLKEETKFNCSIIDKANITTVSFESQGPTELEQVVNAENAFNTKIPFDDYDDYPDNYIHTHIESWNGRTETTLPTIEDSSYRYVLDGQTCYYNNKLLICHGSNWYDAMGNVVS